MGWLWNLLARAHRPPLPPNGDTVSRAEREADQALDRSSRRQIQVDAAVESVRRMNRDVDRFAAELERALRPREQT